MTRQIDHVYTVFHYVGRSRIYLGANGDSQATDKEMENDEDRFGGTDGIRQGVDMNSDNKMEYDSDYVSQDKPMDENDREGLEESNMMGGTSSYATTTDEMDICNANQNLHSSMELCGLDCFVRLQIFNGATQKI